MRTRPAAYCLLITLCLASKAAAQTHLGSIRGTITDPSGSAVVGAPLTLMHEETGLTRTASTGSAGAFSVSQLAPGAYRMEVELAGYKTFVNRTTLQVNQYLRLDVALEIGEVTEEVFVTAPDVPIEQDSVELSTIVDNRQITSLPLDGRNFLELSLLAPGATPAAQGSAGSVRGDFTFSVNGAREDMNEFLLDGVYNNDPKLNTAGVRPPVDAIGEFQLLTSTSDASFGHHPGAHVNVITRSGANQFSGTLYEFFRTKAMNARNAFAPAGEEAPAYERNQFGLSLGGPLVRDHTFFFVDYEGTRRAEGITRVTNVPTLAERTGDFSQSPLPQRPIDPLTCVPFDDPARRPHPLAPDRSVTCLPFPGDMIPVLNPIGAAIAARYPEQNRNVPDENFVSSPTLRDRTDHVDLRVDHIFGDASLLTARYSFNDRRLFEPFSGPGFAAVPGFGTTVPRRAQNVMVSETLVMSPALVNDVRVAFNRVSIGVFHENMGTSLNRDVGLPELSSNARDFGLSFITVSGFSPLGDETNNPQESTTNTFQVLDTLTYVRGDHLLKFGLDVRVTRQDAFRDVQSRGLLMFSNAAITGDVLFDLLLGFPLRTGNALADLLRGRPLRTGGAVLDNPQRLRTESYNFFVHDNFRIRQNLTLSAGLRYEYTSPPVDADDHANVYDPATQSLVQVGTSGIPRAAYGADKNNWAPRVGLAWTPTADGRTVLRGGYGIYYSQSPLAPGEGLYFSPPFFDFNLFFPLPGLPLTLSDPFPSGFPFPLPDSALAFQRDLRTPYLQQWNVSVQRQLGERREIEVAYVGSRGSNLIGARDINQATPSPLPVNPRPVPQFTDIVALESSGSSLYNSLQIKLQQRLSSGLSVLSSYTLGKSTDDQSNFFSSAGDPNFPQDSNNPEAERGRSNFDVRHRFSANFFYELPVGTGCRFLADRGWLSRLLEDWQLTGIVTLQSGRPFTVALLPEIDNSNTGFAALGFGANDRPNLVGDPSVSDPSANRWFDTGVFAVPPFGSFGDAGRNIVEGPGFQNVNVALLKHVPLREGVRLQFRLEAFNVFNHVNFDLPDSFLGSPTFGRILSSGTQRRLQLGFKLLF